MKILWFPRLQFDVDKFHIITWREMINEMEKLGHIVKIAVAGEDKNNILGRSYIEIFQIKIKFLRILTFFISGYFKFIYHYILFRPDVVIFDIYSIWFSIPFALVKKRSRLFVVDNRTPFYNAGTSKSTFKDKVMMFYTRISFNYYRLFLDGMTVITSHYKNYVHQKFNISYAEIGIWGSGVNPSIFSKKIVDNSNNIDDFDGKFIVMQHGGLSLNRGLIESIRAIHQINNEDIMLVLIGDSVGTSKTKDILLRTIHDLKVENNVRIMPPISHSEIPFYISRCNCGIMAYPNIEYWNNNNPIKLLEYLAMGKVVICTDMWTFRNVAGDLNCIQYISNNNSDSIAEAIVYCYKNRDSLEERGNKGAILVREKYTWKMQAINLIEFIKGLQN